MESFKTQFDSEDLSQGLPPDLPEDLTKDLMPGLVQTPDVIRDRAIRFFDYLRAQHTLRDSPVRDIALYNDRRWWEADFPAHSACRVHPGADGVWLQVSKVPIPVPPNPPAKLDSVLDRHFGDPSVPPGFVDGFVERLGLDDEAASDFEIRLRAWLTDEWEPWSERARRANAARSLYQDLFDLYLRLQRQDAEFELVWGHGLLTWNVSGEIIRCPLIVTPCAIGFNGDTGELSVHADGAAVFETDCICGLVDRPERLADLHNEFRENAPDPWAEDLRRYYHQFFQALDLDGLIIDDDPQVPSQQPQIATRSLLFVRRRVPSYTRRFEQLRELIVDGHPVPPPIESLVAEAPDAHISPEWQGISTRLLMPLPSNAEQDAIAHRLATHDGITVQGPPGTGKTHTIANLVSHLLAHGKRVLVTSFKQQPLEILRDMVPEEIRPLCMSVLGSSAGVLTQLEASVQSIYENAVALDRANARVRIDHLEYELARHNEDVNSTRRRLEAVSSREAVTYLLGDRQVTSAELAAWLAENQALVGHIPDRLGEDDWCPLTRGEVARYFDLCRTLDPCDRREGARHLPDWGSLPDGATFRRKMEELTEIHKRLMRAQGRLATWESIDSTPVEDLRVISTELSAATDHLRTISVPWLQAIRDEAMLGEEWLSVWKVFVQAATDAASEIAQRRGRLAPYQIELPTDGLPSKEMFEQLEECRARIAQGRRIGRLASKEARELRDACRIDGEPPRTIEDYDLILDAIWLLRRRYGMLNRWNHDIERVGGTPISTEEPYPEAQISDGVGFVVNALAWETRTWPALRAKLGKLGVLVPERCGQEDMESLLLGIDAAFARHEYRWAIAELEELARSLREGGAYEESSPLWSDLAQALSAGDPDAWAVAFAEAARLDGMRMHIFEADELARRLAEKAPVWSARIASERGDTVTCGDPADIDDLWEWRRAETWLGRILEVEDPVQLRAALDDALEGVRRTTNDLVSASAWLHVSEEMTESRRRSLAVWVQALKKVRESEGAALSKWRAEAETAMAGAARAIPAWVMPIYKVVEVFDPATDPFDVVIVDESSQCDLFSVAALGLGKKAIIVGDDMQMSPQTIVLDEAYVHEDIAQLIPDLPNASLLEPHASLYDVAKRSYRGVIMLREHFRCLPEIITFSNELAYDGRILPLREHSVDRDHKPIVSRFVSEGYRITGTNRNPAEAAAIVDTIAELCCDPAYETATMGVVSLLGDDQAHAIEEALIARLGEAEMNRRKLRCGDPYQFQGDERDVMFLSMVVSRGDEGLTNRPFLEESDRQSVNVAASRARSQLWLFYSVTAEELHTGDVRGWLQRYCTEQLRAVPAPSNPQEQCQTELARALLHALSAQGYVVHPQYKVGRLTIDLVVEGQDGRLAVELDGPNFRGRDIWVDDRRRVEMLERIGWHFHHIRGSEYFRDPSTTLKRLLDRLARLGIKPCEDAVH